MSQPVMKPFSLASKTRSTLRETTSTKRTADEAFTNGEDSKVSREFVTEFDPSKVLTDSKRKALVIQPIPNEWRPEKRMKNLYLPSQSDNENQGLQFLLESVSTSSSDPVTNSTGYGLNVRSTENSHTESKAVAKSEDLVLHKLREDLDRLPDATGFDEFSEVPVEGFGYALLSGYGWKEGRGIGRGWDKKEDVKAVEIQRRTAKEGLGFTGEIPKLTTPSDFKGKQIIAKFDKGGDSGRENEVKKEKNGALYLGKTVRIIRGKNMGMKGKVVAMKGGGYVILRDLNCEDEVKVQFSDFVNVGSLEEESFLKKMKGSKLRDKSEVSKTKTNSKISAEGMKDKRDKESKVLWLRSNIRVRIICKKIKGGRFYLKKGVVLDVVGPTTCDISMDDSKELIQGVDQDLLETAIPRPGGGVIVLYGKHKDVYGSLVERDTENETGVIRDGDTHELINVRLEQIAEYVGDPSDIGY